MLFVFLSKMTVDEMADWVGGYEMIIEETGKTAIADFFVIASGTSDRHVRSLAGNVEASAKAHALQPFGLEGEDAGEWVVVDLGDVVVHVMKPPVREFYQLEKLWAETFSAAA